MPKKKKYRAEAVVHITTRKNGWGEPDMNAAIGASRGKKADHVVVARKLTSPAKARALEKQLEDRTRTHFIKAKLEP